MPSHEAIDLTPRVHDQCVFETQMASRLKSAGREDRAWLYSHVYGEYAVQFPEGLPQDGSEAERVTRYETAFLRRFLTPSTVMVEIGPGRCHLAFAVAPMVRKIYGVDVSALGNNAAGNPSNFEFRLTDGVHMPFDSDSIDLVISNQLMEHLHPEDANDQLQDIFRVLRPGGSYICVTPSRVNGPHDCSGYFDDLPCPVAGGHYAATGLHLKEYTTQELKDLFRAAGFRQVQTWIGARGGYIAVPSSIMTSIEDGLRLVPPSRRKRSSLLGVILGNRIRATK